MGNIRFLFFDLDGTLLNDKKMVDWEAVDYLTDLKKRKDVHYGFATGRHEMSVTPYLRQNGLDTLLDGMVCNSGADIYYFENREHQQVNYVPVEALKTLVNIYKDYSFLTCGFFNGPHYVTVGTNATMEKVVKRNFFQCISINDVKELAPAPRLLLFYDPKDRNLVAQAVQEHPIAGLYTVLAKEVCEYLDERNSKAAGVSRFLSRYGVEMQDVMAFGDAENDRQIMEKAGISVCMKNGMDSIRALADYTTEKTNNESGIMHFLQRHEDLLKDI